MKNPLPQTRTISYEPNGKSRSTCALVVDGVTVGGKGEKVRRCKRFASASSIGVARCATEGENERVNK